MAHEAQLAGRLAFALALCISIGAGPVPVVAASLAFEVGIEMVAAVVAVAVAIVVLATLAHKALVTGPGLNQQAVDAEVLAPEPTLMIGGLDIQFDNSMIASCCIRRSRFFVNTVGVHTLSSIDKPMNHRNSKLYWVCSMRWRYQRTL